jgi:hypothetical protein
MQGGSARGDLSDREIEIDLMQGWATAERIIDEKRPDGIYLRYGELSIGHITPKVGIEPLRGVHLRPILANSLSDKLLVAIAVNGMPKSSSVKEIKPLILIPVAPE